MSKINGNAAAAKLLSFGRVNPGYCLYYVWQAYKGVGAWTAMHAGTAFEAWEKAKGKHPGDMNPPAGVPVYLGKRPGSDAGDIVISLGNGRVRVTEAPGKGNVVGDCTIEERMKQTGRPYLGWSECIFDQAISFTPVAAPSGGQPTGPKPSAETLAVQKKLNTLGYKLTEDGIKGPKTIAAIKHFQTRYGLEVDGIWGPRTERKYQSIKAQPHTQPKLTYALIQRGLNKFGYKLAVDNIWGKKSSNALADFQRKHGLTVDRIVGPKTRAALGI